MTSINQFDTITITAKTIEGNVDNVTYIAMNSYFHTAMTFTGQNYGARKISRIRRVVIYSLIQVVTLGFLVSTTEYLLAENICALFLGKADPNFAYIISSAADMCRFVLPTYFLCGIMEVLSGTVRAMGYSISSMIIVLLSACGFRIVWFIYLFNKFEVLHTVKGLLLGFPVSWVLSILGLAALFFVVMHRTKRSMGAASPQIKEQN
jgi:Na+-driven multidrug efflux pump